MNNIAEVLGVILIGVIVANFLLNTGRFVKATELCKECLLFLNSTSLIKEKIEVFDLLYKEIYLIMFNSYWRIGDFANAIKYNRKILRILRKYDKRLEECSTSIALAKLYFHQCKYVDAKELLEKTLLISTEIGNKSGEVDCYEYLGVVNQFLGEYEKAKENFVKALAIRKEIGDRKGQAWCYGALAPFYIRQCKYFEAKELLEKGLPISTEIGDKNGEADCYGNLGVVYQSLGEYGKAKEYHVKALAIGKEIGDQKGQACCYANLGLVYQLLGEYETAKEYQVKALAIKKEIGDRKGEASCYGRLGTLFQCVGEYDKAKEYLERALAMKKEFGDRDGEAVEYEELGKVFELVGEHRKAKGYYEKVLMSKKEKGDRKGEAFCYGHLGTVFQSFGQYEKAKEYHEKALAIEKEIGDRRGEASSYGNLGTVFQYLGEYEKAKEYHEKALVIQKQIGDRRGEASSYGSLGTVFKSLGEYEKAREYLAVALAIQKEIGDREGEAYYYGNLGGLLYCVGEDVKAKKYLEKAVAINRKIRDRKGEGIICANLGNLLINLGKYAEANEHLQKALAVSKEIGDRRVEAGVYGNLGFVFRLIGDYKKAVEYLEKALTISKEIGDRFQEASNYQNLGSVFENLGEYGEAEECHKRALAISQEIGHVEKQSTLLHNLGWVMILTGKIREAFTYLLPSIQKHENLRSFLQDNDQLKISFSHKHVRPYWVLSALFYGVGNTDKALYVSELGRARALADLMSTQYSLENQISANPQSWVGIESVMDKEALCTCLYFSYFYHFIFAWILKVKKTVHFRQVDGKEMILHEGLLGNENLDEFFANERFRRLGILPEELCEDRSLNDIQRNPGLSGEDSPKTFQIEKDDADTQELKRNLSLCYKLVIAPVADLVEGPEIIIVLERFLYNIPFAALLDERGKYLSQTYRIRVVPSLTTLKFIQDSPADYHSQTGALIVGNPVVGRVRYKGCFRDILGLPCAESEAKMVGEKLGVKPLIGKQATKPAVLQAINSVNLIHFAAHGNSERGEIALAPAIRTSDRCPQEEDYLLTMSDISKVQLRAKLVVLSCCHSARGQIRSEGVVGIARAFLGSGARSVLVALWALEDSATEQFMSRFYEHLVRGESASESLHEAMKWMRCNGYSEIRQWAPFMLIGDNVTFDFGKSK